MHDRSLPASPNWYCSRCSDVTGGGLLGVGAKNIIYLIDVSASTCRVTGELVGHKDLVSGFSFCQHEGQSHICVSSSSDGSIRFWDSDTKALIKEHAAHQVSTTSVHWSPVDKNLVVSGDEKGVVICHWYHTGDTSRFFPEPRTIFCLTCSPHTWTSVAVGYKDGMIVLVDVSKKGEVTHRLRGHDDEIHSLAWSPVVGEDGLSSRAEDGEASNEVSAVGEQGCFLASGSKDQTVRIWSTAKGRSVMTLKLPYLKKRGSVVDPGIKERLWLSVLWPKGRPTQLVSSCFSGELMMWDLTRSGKQRWTLLGTSSEGQNHSRIVFNMSVVKLQDGRELLISTSMDREIKCWDLASLDCCWTLPTLGGFVYALTFSPVGAGCLAIGVGDNMIRVWNTLSTQNQYDTRFFWQGIKSKVTALAWHPAKEGSLAFGTDDGKVGIYEVFSNKPPHISSSYHRKTVYTLAWGPPVPPMSFGAVGGKLYYSLYSCAGEGTILQHDPSKLSGEASDIDKLIRDTNDIKHKLSPHTDLSWKPDGKVVAIGNEDGCIDVYQAPSLKLLCSLQQHHKIINTLRWHHSHSSVPEHHGLLASGSSNAAVYVHDLHSVIENPPENPVVLTEPYRRLCGHTSKITSMAWSPHHDARLVTASYDGTAQVSTRPEPCLCNSFIFEGFGLIAVCNYRGHVGYLLCVDWSPVDPDVIWSGGKDFTVQEWRVSKQEFTNPPKGKKMVELREKMKTNPKQKRKNKKASGAGGAAPSEMNGEPASGEKAEAGQSGEEELDEAACIFKTVSICMNVPDTNLLKKKKPRSMLPISTSMDHRPKEDLLQDCITLASVKHNSMTDSGEHIHLGLFSDRQALHRMFEAEGGHMEAGHYDSVVYLQLWTGDLEGALQLATEKGELSDHLLTIAPMAGFEVWKRTVEAFVKQLCLQEQYLKAASHLLSVNKLYEAIDLLQSHRLYREAIALVKARLPADDPILKELYTGWAAVLEKDGHFSAAAKCYLAAGTSFDAAKVIARKNDTSSLMTAATLARISGEVTLAQSLAMRCTKDLAAAQDWVQAQEALSSQKNLLVTFSVLFVPRVAFNPQVLLHSSLHLTRSVLSWLLEDDGQLIKELWQAVAWLRDPGHFCVSAELCRLLFPDGTCLKHPKTLHHTEEAAKAAADSLQAFVLYHRLYELWWSNSADNTDPQNGLAAADSCPADEVEDKANEDISEVEEKVCPPLRLGNLDFDASLLLSEPHAACQATQRSVTEVQERLAAMVLQHSRAQGGQLDPGEEQADVAPQISSTDAQSSALPCLSSVSCQMYPHPDVVECCLVLLHLSKSSLSVSERLQEDAKALLRKYGSGPSTLRASQRFLT
uniref:Gem (nuclear organelle) associated protein 5 n=1 Tax=Mastacembelus armatus TaxID=205130 RepID=A0A7N8YHC7_9TELE